MKARDRILQKLRAAAPDGDEWPDFTDPEVYADHRATELPALIAQFGERLTSLSGEFHLVEDAPQAAACLLDLLDSAENDRALAQPSPLLQTIAANQPKLRDRLTWLPEQLASPDFAGYGTGISEADFLIARTGSLLLRNTGTGGRRLSVLPPLHIAVATTARLVPSIDAALRQLQRSPENWSFATLATGPSRTADIQKNLVLGAHGPKRQAVILIRETRG